MQETLVFEGLGCVLFFGVVCFGLGPVLLVGVVSVIAELFIHVYLLITAILYFIPISAFQNLLFSPSFLLLFASFHLQIKIKQIFIYILLIFLIFTFINKIIKITLLLSFIITF